MTGHQRRDGATYHVSPEEVGCFARDGFVHLRAVLSEAEVAELEVIYGRFLRREIEVAGRDFCDMSGEYTRPIEDFSIVNVMLPRTYHPPLRDNIYERRMASIAQQLCGDGMVLDYDQLVAKPPGKVDAVFHWHQDLAYWPSTADTRTASAWLAIDDSTVDNGCLCFLPGSHREPELRPHRPLLGNRDESHALAAEVDEARDETRRVPIRRGDITVHHERVVHGSRGNHSTGWRRAWVIAFRAASAVEAERAQGFTHSHNDDLEVLKRVGVEGESRGVDS